MKYTDQRRFRAQIWLGISLLFLTASAGAATYRVGKGSPYPTLQALRVRLQAGDIVEVAGGATYPGGAILSGNGTADRPIVIRGIKKGGARPVLSGVGKGNMVLKIQGSHFSVEGFDMTAEGDSHAFRGFYAVGDDIALRDSVVHDCKCTGISGSDASGSLLLDHVEVFHCGLGLMAHQIYVGSSPADYPNAVFRMQFCYVHDGSGGNNVKSRVTRNEIDYNWIEGAFYHELDLVGPDPKAHRGLSAQVHCDSDIVGNVLIKTPSSQGTLVRLGTDGTGVSNGHYRFVNNTVIVRSAAAESFGLFWVRPSTQALSVCDNVFWAAPALERKGGGLNMMRNEVGALLHTGGVANWLPPGTIGKPVSWSGVSTVSPGFADAGANRFRPLPGSPLKGAGLDPEAVDGESGVTGGLWPPAYEPEPSIEEAAPNPRPPRTPLDIGAYAAMR